MPMHTAAWAPTAAAGSAAPPPTASCFSTTPPPAAAVNPTYRHAPMTREPVATSAFARACEATA